jgi:membrane protein DedA with SNARE-associated domain
VGQTIFQILSQLFARYGYGAVFLGVMLENAGIPVPGETVLLFGGFLADHGELSLGWLIVTAASGASVGDSLGYALGFYGGTALLRHLRGRAFLSERRYAQAEQAMLRYGAWAVFAARFITGLRIVAGPLAGAIRMDYPRFLLANIAGAIVWASVIGATGYLLGTSWQRLTGLASRLDWVVLAAAVAIALGYWLVRRPARKA